MIRPMREELTRLGVEEARTPEQVDAAVKETEGVAMALRHTTRPARAVTVFAGADIEATERARGYFTGRRPSSPSIALLKDGQLVYMMERHQIEGQDAPSIAAELIRAFDEHCATANTANAG
jgi:putative YphP/YqiW family bacilliredoxin